MHRFRWLILFVCLSHLSPAQDPQNHLNPSPVNMTGHLLLFPAPHVPEYQFNGEGWLEQRSPEGQLLSRALLRKGKLDGVWTSWYPSGRILDSGRLEMNLPDGEWKTWYPDGQRSSIRSFNAEGYRRVREEFRLAHPRRTFYPLTALYLQDPSMALAQLDFTAAYPARGGHRYASVQELVSANASGTYPYQPVFAHCLLDGLYMNFWPDGNTKDSGFYKLGMRSGVWIHKRAAGETETGTYQNGARHREWKTFSASGMLCELVHYRNGKIIWRKHYN